MKGQSRIKIMKSFVNTVVQNPDCLIFYKAPLISTENGLSQAKLVKHLENYRFFHYFSSMTMHIGSIARAMTHRRIIDRHIY